MERQNYSMTLLPYFYLARALNSKRIFKAEISKSPLLILRAGTQV